VPYTQAALAMGKAVVANESSSFRWTLIAAVKERSAPIGGCASNEWYQDATKLLWTDTVPAAWAAANGFSIWSMFPTEDLMLLSKINSQSHCTVNDQFQGQMQGTGHTSGRVKLGALRERYWMLYRTPKPSPPALAAPILPPAG
jgi:hypothetical protein